MIMSLFECVEYHIQIPLYNNIKYYFIIVFIDYILYI